MTRWPGCAPLASPSIVSSLSGPIASLIGTLRNAILGIEPTDPDLQPASTTEIKKHNTFVRNHIMGSDCRSTGSVGTLGRTRIPIQNNHYTLMILLISELLILAVSGSHNHRK